MKVVVAIDSFKGSLTSMRAVSAAREGILRAVPDADVVAERVPWTRWWTVWAANCYSPGDGAAWRAGGMRVWNTSRSGYGHSGNCGLLRPHIGA